MGDNDPLLNDHLAGICHCGACVLLNEGLETWCRGLLRKASWNRAGAGFAVGMSCLEIYDKSGRTSDRTRAFIKDIKKHSVTADYSSVDILAYPGLFGHFWRYLTDHHEFEILSTVRQTENFVGDPCAAAITESVREWAWNELLIKI